MIRDRHRFRARLRALSSDLERLSAGPAKPPAAASVLDAILAQIDASSGERTLREKNLPVPTFPDDLPVVQRRDEIKAAIRDHQVIVLCGETGSGKTTQLPKICLE